MLIEVQQTMLLLLGYRILSSFILLR